MTAEMPKEIILSPNKLKLPNLPVRMKARRICDVRGLKNAAETLNRRVDVQNNEYKMTEQNHQNATNLMTENVKLT